MRLEATCYHGNHTHVMIVHDEWVEPEARQKLIDTGKEMLHASIENCHIHRFDTVVEWEHTHPPTESSGDYLKRQRANKVMCSSCGEIKSL